jgi:predicted alpha/beta hydrolase family esterase
MQIRLGLGILLVAAVTLNIHSQRCIPVGTFDESSAHIVKFVFLTVHSEIDISGRVSRKGRWALSLDPALLRSLTRH